MRHFLILLPGLLFAEDAATRGLQSHMERYRNQVMSAAEKFSDADYAFKPSPDVMTVHEILGHLTDANYSICAPLSGAANPDKGGNTKANPTKAALIPALRKSFDYCLAAVTAADGKWAEKTKARTPREFSWVALHLLDHTALHYGNLVTYMRMKGLVPLESEPKK
jgi:uncharacterized damage-inducible protein DinB